MSLWCMPTGPVLSVQGLSQEVYGARHAAGDEIFRDLAVTPSMNGQDLSATIPLHDNFLSQKCLSDRTSCRLGATLDEKWKGWKHSA
jgi:hypothetical protein